MVRAVILALVVIGCHQPIKPDAQQEPKIRPWQTLIDHCKVEPDTVCCPPDVMQDAVNGTIDLWSLNLELNQKLITCKEIYDIDQAALDGQLWACKHDLSSPWRSPILWGVIGVVAGAALATGLVVGVDH